MLGDLDSAEERLRQALDCPPWIALSAAALARVLRLRDCGSSEPEELLTRARTIAHAHGMTTLVARCTDLPVLGS